MLTEHEHEARTVAGDWHSGQSSALYAFSSSGHIDALTEIELERVVAECERRVADPVYASNLSSEDPAELLERARAALEFVRANMPTARAYALGVEAAEAAAGWAADGNSDEVSVRETLELLEAGDPEAYDRLPARPDLSGEWADAPTPTSLYEQLTGRDAHADASWDGDAYGESVEELCDAWERGVADTFEAACEAALRRQLA